jgi:flagellar biosynthesis GTPase FlhF
VNVNDQMQVQCASLRCNKLSHAHISDNIGDTINQFQDCLMVYYQSSGNDYRDGKKFNVQQAIRWIEHNVRVLVDLLPSEKNVSVNKEGLPQNIAARVRLACVVPKSLVRQIQEWWAAIKPDEEPSFGFNKVISAHFLKMVFLYELDDEEGWTTADYLVRRMDQMNIACDLKKFNKQMTPAESHLVDAYLSYEDVPGRICMNIWQSTPMLVQSMKKHIMDLRKQHKDDVAVLGMIPHPGKDYTITDDKGYLSDLWLNASEPNGEYKGYTVEGLAVVRSIADVDDHTMDFELFQKWHPLSSWQQVSINSGKKGRGKAKLVRKWVEPKITNATSMALMPKTVQNAWDLMTRAIKVFTETRAFTKTQVDAAAKVEEDRVQATKAAIAQAKEEKAQAVLAAQAEAEQRRATVLAEQATQEAKEATDKEIAELEKKQAEKALEEDARRDQALKIKLAQIDDAATNDHDDDKFATCCTSDLNSKATRAAKKRRPKKKKQVRLTKERMSFKRGSFADDEEVNKVFEERVTLTKHDVRDLFTTHNASFKGRVEGFMSDVPYGVNKRAKKADGFDPDPDWPKELVKIVCKGMADNGSEKCVVVLGMGTFEQVAMWREELAEAKFTLEPMTKCVTDAVGHQTQGWSLPHQDCPH